MRPDQPQTGAPFCVGANIVRPHPRAIMETRAPRLSVILSGAPSEIPPCSRAALLRSSIPLRSTQNDTEGA